MDSIIQKTIFGVKRFDALLRGLVWPEKSYQDWVDLDSQVTSIAKNEGKLKQDIILILARKYQKTDEEGFLRDFKSSVSRAKDRLGLTLIPDKATPERIQEINTQSVELVKKYKLDKVNPEKYTAKQEKAAKQVKENASKVKAMTNSLFNQKPETKLAKQITACENDSHCQAVIDAISLNPAFHTEKAVTLTKELALKCIDARIARICREIWEKTEKNLSHKKSVYMEKEARA